MPGRCAYGEPSPTPNAYPHAHRYCDTGSDPGHAQSSTYTSAHIHPYAYADPNYSPYSYASTPHP